MTPDTAQSGQKSSQFLTWGVSLAIFSAAFAATHFIAFKRDVPIDLPPLIDRTFRMFHGQLPYRDFYCPTTPGTYLVQAFLWKMFGATVEPMKIYIAALNGILGVLLFGFLRRLKVAALPSLLFTLLFLAWSPNTLMSHPWYDSDASACALVFLFCLHRALKEEGLHWSLLAGVFSGLAFQFKQNVGMACVLLLAAVLLFELRNKDRWKALGLSLIGSAMIIAPLFAVYAAKGSLPDLLNWTFRYASESKLARFGSTSGFVLSPLHSLLYARGNNMFLWLWFALYGLATVLIEYRIFSATDEELKKDARHWRLLNAVSFLVTYSLMISNAGLVYQIHMIFLWVPILSLYRYFPVGLKWKNSALALVVAALVFQSLRIGFLRKRFTAPDSSVMSYLFKAPALKGYYYEEKEGRQIDALVDFFISNLKPGENLFVFPHPQILYCALGILPPTKVTHFLVGGQDTRAKDQPEIIDSLSGRNVRWAVLRKRDDRAYPLISDYVAGHFEVRETLDDFVILYRPDDNFTASAKSRKQVAELVR